MRWRPFVPGIRKYCDVPGSPCLSKKANQMCGSFLFFKFLCLVHLWTDQRIPGPVSCRCPGGLLETPPRWHATRHNVSVASFSWKLKTRQLPMGAIGHRSNGSTFLRLWKMFNSLGNIYVLSSYWKGKHVIEPTFITTTRNSLFNNLFSGNFLAVSEGKDVLSYLSRVSTS